MQHFGRGCTWQASPSPCHFSHAAVVSTRRVDDSSRKSSTLCKGTSDLLDWMVSRGTRPTDLAISVGEVECGGRRGLIAQRDIEAGTVLLSVPMPSTFVDPVHDPGHGVHFGGIQTWGGRMAMRLLSARHAADTCVSEANQTVDAKLDAERLDQWLDALPAPEDLLWPSGHFNEAELRLIQDPFALQEAQLRAVDFQSEWLGSEAQLKRMGLTFDDWLWANAAIHSRSFVYGNAEMHMTCPGIDMANHTSEANAVVRVLESPNRSQGLSAVSEITARTRWYSHLVVCDPPPAECSRFELVAGEAEISAGSEVTLSYGRWPNEIFLLYFGFIPPGNTSDSITIFQDQSDWMRAVIEAANDVCTNVQLRKAVVKVLEARLADVYTSVVMPVENLPDHLSVSVLAFDERLLQLGEQMDQIWGVLMDVSAPEFGEQPTEVRLGCKVLTDRLQHRLASYGDLQIDSATLDEVENAETLSQLSIRNIAGSAGLAKSLVKTAESLFETEEQLEALGLRKLHVELALKFRIGKQKILVGALAAVPSVP